MKAWFFLTAALAIVLGGQDVQGCTMVMAARNGVVLAGNNEDWSNPLTRVTFVPAGADRFGCIFFGFSDGNPQGGMNDRGLFIDGNAVAPTGWRAEADKPYFRGILLLEILQRCATTADVQSFFERYNVPALSAARFPVADRNGASLVVEYAQGGVRFVREKGWYQVSTNFLRSDHPGDPVPCNRFKLAEQIMGAASEPSIPLIRAVLSATHQEGDHPTVYSNIYDLKAGIVYLYLFHNFEEVVELRLADELSKGGRSLELPSLFRVQPHAAKQFSDLQVQPSYSILMEVYQKTGGAAALARYEEMRRAVRWVSRYDIGEEQIGRLASYLLLKGDAQTALGFYLALSRSFPDSWRAHEGIARSQMALGNNAAAIGALRRALEINPDNRWASDALQQLEGKK